MADRLFSSGIWINKTPIKFTKSLPDAEYPFSERNTDPTLNLTLVRRCDNRTEDLASEINTFNLGLIVKPPLGFHGEIISHPQLLKAGYMVVGPVVVNPLNEEDMEIPLLKFKDGPDLELPFAGAQLIVRQTQYNVIDTEGSNSSRRESSKPEKDVKMKPPAGRGGKNHFF